MIVTVQSEKDPNVTYDVNLDTGECSCPHYQRKLKEENAKDNGTRRCKHYPTALAFAKATSPS